MTAIETRPDASPECSSPPPAPSPPDPPADPTPDPPTGATQAQPTGAAAAQPPRLPLPGLLAALATVALLANLVAVLGAERAGREARSDLAAAARAGATAAEVREETARVDAERARPAADLDETTGLIALARAALGAEAAGRDGRRPVLAEAEQRLADLRLALDGTNGRIATQNGAVEDLRTCFTGITRSLNLAGLDLLDGAAAELFAVAEACGRAEQVLGGVP